MPGQAMSPVYEVGWYGKIPAAGDFVHRRLPREIIMAWDTWLQGNLAALRGPASRSASAAIPPDGGMAGRIWNFLVPAGTGQGWVQAGCITPSTDRVGRKYAVLALVVMDPAGWQADWVELLQPAYRQLGAGLRHVVSRASGADYLDRILQQVRQETAANLRPRSPAPPGTFASSSQDIMDVLNSGRPPERPAAPDADWLPASAFNPYAHTSHWWTNATEGGAMIRHVHGGRLDGSLFNRLFVPLNIPRTL